MLTGLIMTIIGYGPINYFFRKESLLLKLALSFLIGFGLIVLPLFLLVYNHISLSSTLVTVEICLFLLISFVLVVISPKKKQSGEYKQQDKEKLKLHQRLLAGGIFFIVISSFVINLYWPVSTWDSISLYDLRAKIYSRGELLTSLWLQVNKDPEAFSYYYSYPPTTSLAHTVGYFLSEPNIMGLYSFFYATLIIVFFSFLKKKAGIGLTLLFTFLLVLNQTLFIHSTFAYTNLPYTAVILTSLLMLEQYLKNNGRHYFYTSIFLTMISIMIRSIDPFYLILAGYLLFHALKKRALFKDTLIFIVIIAATKFLADSYFTRDIILLTGKAIPLQAISFIAVINALFSPAKIKEAVDYIYIALKVYQPYLLAFLLTIFLFFKSVKKEIGLALFIIFSILIIVPGTLFLSTYYKDWNKIPDSITRLMLFLYPTILYYIGSLEEVKKLPAILFRPKKIFVNKK